MAAPSAASANAPSLPDPSFAALLAGRPMLSLREGALHVEDVPLARIAAVAGTPCYAYGAGTMQARYRALKAAFAAQSLAPTICYALKANDNLAVVATFAREGAGADTVSEGDIRRALAAGVPADRIVFSGVGKTEREIRYALSVGLRQINVESAEELAMVGAIAQALGRRAPVALRVNPDVDARTHAKITTGLTENKFGISMTVAPALADLCRDHPGLDLVGLTVHIGSQVGHLEPYRDAFERLAALARELLAAGHPIRAVDLGGGLGIPYRDEDGSRDHHAYAAIVKDTVGGLGLEILLEPGRWLVGPAGVLLARVVLVKTGEARRFVVLDAAMNDLIRPSLYDAWHGMLPVDGALHAAPLSPADVVGPVCESGDTFTKGRLLPALRPGDLVALLDAGAYGAVMASSYNTRPLAPEVLVHGSRLDVIRPRPTYAEMLAQDHLPSWLAPPPASATG
ncbi:MAG: diaminopimelate decarboxylase [Alphaproteobacteria bacterium]|nr:diaminopimelate decarboxylase [Alphaproteobacteria bacterium]